MSLSPVCISYTLQSLWNPFSAKAHVTVIDRTAKPFAHIEVIPARPKQESILANLLELYAHDFSEFNDLELGADGRFGYSSLALYWSEPGRHPFLVWVEGKLAGLVLVKRGSEVSSNETVWDVAEFFDCPRIADATRRLHSKPPSRGQ